MHKQRYFTFGRSFVATALMLIGALTARADDTVETDAETAETVRHALLAAGRNALRIQDLDNAAFYYQRYLSRYPDDQSVALEFAGVLTQASRFAEALAWSDHVLARDATNPEAQTLRAVALGRLGRVQEAQRILETLRARFPDDGELRRIEAGFRAMQGDRGFARDLYRDLLAAGLNNVRDWEDVIQLMAAEAQWDRVIETYLAHRDQLTPTDPIRLAVLRAHLARFEWEQARQLSAEISAAESRRDAALAMAEHLAAAQRRAEAVAFLETLLDPSAPDPDLTVRIALLEAYDRHAVRAWRRLEALPRRYQNDAVALGRVKVLWASGRPSDALAMLDELPESAALSLDGQLTRAGLYYDLHREWEIPPLIAAAQADLRHAGHAERKLAQVLDALARLRAGDSEGSARAIHALRRIAPNDLAPDILEVMRMRVARRTAAYAEAVARLGMRLRDYRPGVELVRPALLDDVPADAWRAAAEARPGNVQVLLRLAQAEMDLGVLPSAIERFQVAALEPEVRGDALIGLATAALRMGDSRRAEYALQSLGEVPLTVDALTQGARIAFLAGKPGWAEAFLARIPKADGDHPEAIAVRAAWLIRADRQQEALRLLAGIGPESAVHVATLSEAGFRLGTLAQDASDPVYALAIQRLRDLSAWRGDHPQAPTLSDALLLEVDLRMMHNQYAQAHERLLAAETRNPGDLRVAERLVVTSIRQGRRVDAEPRIRTLLRRRPNDAAQRAMLARLLVWDARYDLAWREYEALIADYPADQLFPLEYASARNRVMGRLQLASTAYAEYNRLDPGAPGMGAEEADVWLLRGLPRTAGDHYQRVLWANPDDAQVRQSMEEAQRRLNWGVDADVSQERREGRDRAVDLDQSNIEAGVRFPRGPEGLDAGVRLGVIRWNVADAPGDRRGITAQTYRLHGDWRFHNAMSLVADYRRFDADVLPSVWDGRFEAGFQGREGWKIAGVVGRDLKRDNAYTLMNGMHRDWIGAYAQWRPVMRLESFVQARALSISRPGDAPLLPEPDEPDTAIIRDPVDADTLRDNRGFDGVVDLKWHLNFFPRSLVLWGNGYLYQLQRQNALYWTPESAFLSGKVGVYWRHDVAARHLPGEGTFYYGAHAAIGHDSEGDTATSLQGELGWRAPFGLALSVDAGLSNSRTYDERIVRLQGRYHF